MNQFIKLHQADTNLPFLINISNIACVEKESNKRKKDHKTIVYFNTIIRTPTGGQAAYAVVNENVERIYNMMYEDTTK